MLSRSRASRLLALALLLLSPGAGGTVLAVAHPCPGEVAEPAGGAGAAHESHSQHQDQRSPRHGTDCCCFGSCACSLQAAGLPKAAAPVPPSVDAPASRALLAAAEPLLVLPARLLPPATAPPIGRA